MRKKIIVIIIMLVFISGCTKKESNVVNVLNWSSYIPSEVINNFEKETGIKVNYSTYSSNEELLAKLNGTKKGTYDLVFPSDYMVDILIKKGSLEELDKTKLSNYSNLDPEYLGASFDKYNNYSLPFLLATTSISYNSKYVDGPINSYNDLLDSKYENSIVLLDDERIVIGMGLLALGYDMNSTNEVELEDAREWIEKLKPNIKAYDSDSPKNFLITEEAYVGVIWNAESALATNYKNEIKTSFPKEGVALSMDNFCIPKDSKNMDNTYKLIDYLLREDVMKEIIESYPYKSVNRKTNNLLSEEYLNNIASNIPNYVFENGHFVDNIGNNIKKYDKVWIKIK